MSTSELVNDSVAMVSDLEALSNGFVLLIQGIIKQKSELLARAVIIGDESAEIIIKQDIRQVSKIGDNFSLITNDVRKHLPDYIQSNGYVHHEDTTRNAVIFVTLPEDNVKIEDVKFVNIDSVDSVDSLKTKTIVATEEVEPEAVNAISETFHSTPAIAADSAQDSTETVNTTSFSTETVTQEITPESSISATEDNQASTTSETEEIVVTRVPGKRGRKPKNASAEDTAVTVTVAQITTEENDEESASSESGGKIDYSKADVYRPFYLEAMHQNPGAKLADIQRHTLELMSTTKISGTIVVKPGDRYETASGVPRYKAQTQNLKKVLESEGLFIIRDKGCHLTDAGEKERWGNFTRAQKLAFAKKNNIGQKTETKTNVATTEPSTEITEEGTSLLEVLSEEN